MDNDIEIFNTLIKLENFSLEKGENGHLILTGEKSQLEQFCALMA